MPQGDIFGGNPIDGQGIFQSTDGSELESDISDVFNGRFDVSGGFFRDTVGGGNAVGLGRQGDFTLQDVGNGRFSLKTEIDINRINRPTNDQVLRTIEGVIDVLQSDGSIASLDVGATAVNQIGWQAVAYPRDDGSTGITHVKGIYLSSTEVEMQFGLGWRLATPEEAVEAAVSRRLYLDNLDELKRIGEDEDIRDDNGNVDLSGVIRWVMARNDLSDIRAFSQYLFE